jgi:hypothetical protein
MMLCRRIIRHEGGVAAIEMAFALPILIVMIWMFVQLAQVYRAVAGIQQALGEGARAATIWPTKTPDEIHDIIEARVYGIGPGDFDPVMPECGNDGTETGNYLDLKVTYDQDTNLLLMPGPHIHVERTKRVWVAGDCDA